MNEDSAVLKAHIMKIEVLPACAFILPALEIIFSIKIHRLMQKFYKTEASEK